MSEENQGQLHDATGGGVAATHPAPSPLRILAGPSTADEFNTVQSAIFPIACWRIENVRFDFDSSLLLPAVATESALLKKLIDKHSKAAQPPTGAATPPPAALFGHCDPEGSDDYNKSLGGRRAAAVYAMLTRRAEIWEDLYSNTAKFTSIKAIGDKWGTRAIKIMLNGVLKPQPATNAGATASPSTTTTSSTNSTGQSGVPLVVDGKGGPATSAAIKQFQSQNGLGASGNADVDTRKKLYLAYMDKLCVDASGSPFTLDPKTGFLGQNADANGKVDFQGCGEFNPVMLFSNADLQKYTAATDKTARNNANEINRRVMVLLFRPGAKVS